MIAGPAETLDERPPIGHANARCAAAIAGGRSGGLGVDARVPRIQTSSLRRDPARKKKRRPFALLADFRRF